MAVIHDLIEEGGKHRAILAGLDRSIVEVAANYLGEEDTGLGFAYSGWAQCALPHKRLADEVHWGITSEKVRLVVEPGRRPLQGSEALEWVGVPYGSHARLILLYLQTEALRTSSREVELGRSLREWLGKLGISVGGMTGKSGSRSSRTHFTMQAHFPFIGHVWIRSREPEHRRSCPLYRRGKRKTRSIKSRNCQTVRGFFFEQLKKHPVPLEEAAIKALSNNAPALDAYLWLAYRLHALKGDRLVTWTALKGQFGTGFSKLAQFQI